MNIECFDKLNLILNSFLQKIKNKLIIEVFLLDKKYFKGKYDDKSMPSFLYKFYFDILYLLE